MAKFGCRVDTESASYLVVKPDWFPNVIMAGGRATGAPGAAVS